MLVTTSYDAHDDIVLYSQQLAAELQWTWVARGKQSLEQLRANHNARQMFIVTQKELKYYEDEQPEFFFHPSLATIRFKRMLNGEADALIFCSGVEPGDIVLDCTAGMATDAIVLSHVTGLTGRVVALESELIPYILVREGLQRYSSSIEPLNEAMRRIEVKLVEHTAYLKQLPDRSVDVVYFDPMFRKAMIQSSALQPLRGVANHKPLQQQAVNEAKRVARKTVVMKEHRNSGEFARLGFSQICKPQSKIAYGVINI